MTTLIYCGGAPRVQQVATYTVTDVTNTRTAIFSLAHPSGVGTAVSMCTVTGDGVYIAATFAAAIAAAFNAVNHSFARGYNYIGGITAAASGAVVTFTANSAGIPFVMTKSGTTTDALVATTANSGPWSYDVAGNWADGAVPTAGADVQISGQYDILYGLNQSGVAIGGFSRFNHSGRIGWQGMPLKIQPDEFIHNNSFGGLAFIDFGSTAIPLRFIDAGQLGPIATHITGSALTNIDLEAGNLGVGWLEGDAVAATLLRNLGGSMYVGPLVTANGTLTYKQSAGYGRFNADAAATLIDLLGGRFEESSKGAWTTYTNNGADAKLMGSGAIATANFYAGFTDLFTTKTARVIAASNLVAGAAIIDESVISLTARPTPIGGKLALGGGQNGAR